eukprot:2670911-Pyramimonas_sp.AAC.1
MVAQQTVENGKLQAQLRDTQAESQAAKAFYEQQAVYHQYYINKMTEQQEKMMSQIVTEGTEVDATRTQPSPSTPTEDYFAPQERQQVIDHKKWLQQSAAAAAQAHAAAAAVGQLPIIDTGAAEVAARQAAYQVHLQEAAQAAAQKQGTKEELHAEKQAAQRAEQCDNFNVPAAHQPVPDDNHDLEADNWDEVQAKRVEERTLYEAQEVTDQMVRKIIKEEAEAMMAENSQGTHLHEQRQEPVPQTPVATQPPASAWEVGPLLGDNVDKEQYAAALRMRNLDEPSSIPTEQPSPCCCTPTEVASPAQPDKQEEISPT